MLDGDDLRHGINGDLGFSREDRLENVRRTAHMAALLAEPGTLPIVSLISPYASDREAAGRIVESAGLEFVEVFVDTPLHECERRDPKGPLSPRPSRRHRGVHGAGRALRATKSTRGAHLLRRRAVS